MAMLLLGNVIQIFEGFTYEREWLDPTGRHWALEFTAHINNYNLKGIDLITLGPDGKIKLMEILIRPLNALKELQIQMGQRLGLIKAK